jgi:hypothetical protein
MLKRLAAILFIFAIAGQVSAGVCGCFDGGREDKHACCKRDKLSGDSIRTKPCCDTNCMSQQSEKVEQERTQAATKIKFQAVVHALQGEATMFSPIESRTPVVASPSSDHRLKYARPPQLYLRHHAFLI